MLILPSRKELGAPSLRSWQVQLSWGAAHPFGRILRIGPKTEVDGWRSLMGQAEKLFPVSTPWDACVICALGWRLMG
jgi:hypothetical protein